MQPPQLAWVAYSVAATQRVLADRPPHSFERVPAPADLRPRGGSPGADSGGTGAGPGAGPGEGAGEGEGAVATLLAALCSRAQELLPAAAVAGQGEAAGWGPLQLSQMAWALGCLGHCPQGPLLSQLARYCQQVSALSLYCTYKPHILG
jgi:hypothetical protein